MRSYTQKNKGRTYGFKISARIMAWLVLFFTQTSLALAQVTIKNPLGNTTIGGVVRNLTDFILNLGIAVSSIVFIVGGFQYLFSGGSEQKVKQAKSTLMYGVIGLVALFFAKSAAIFIQNLIL